jgi:hypothetical protein
MVEIATAARREGGLGDLRRKERDEVGRARKGAARFDEFHGTRQLFPGRAVSADTNSAAEHLVWQNSNKWT